MKSSEKIKIKDEYQISLRPHNEFASWHSAQFHFEKYKELKDKLNKEQKFKNSIEVKSHLFTSIVMSQVTIETLLNNLCDYYLPKEISEDLLERDGTLDRWKEITKHLTGQYREYDIKIEEKKHQKIKINKIDLDDFFGGGGVWNNILLLKKKRDDIVHPSVQSKIIKGNNSNSRKIQDQEDIKINNPEELINNVETFFTKLRCFLNKSIDDPVDRIDKMFFNFLEN